MTGRIPQSFIDDLVARVDIVEVIEARVPLKKAGAEFKACCPFHREKTPSFTVSPGKQFYHCFGCGAHGSALGFLMEFERLEFVDAVEELARGLGIEVPREGREGSGDEAAQQGLFDVLARCRALFRARLAEEPRALDYLRQRGVSTPVAERFGLGYAPPEWGWLLGRFAHAEHQVLERAGMLSRADSGRLYDRFRHRLMFPILDRRGRVIAFGGRLLDGEGPKYLNSPETPIFHKGRELYGLYESLHAAPKPTRLLVVEGYMDVVALAEHGIEGVVATLGTATTSDHLQAVFRRFAEVVFCFDGDAAGRKAAEKALQVAAPHLLPGREARFLFLPQGEDPDSLVRTAGADALRRRIESAVPLADFLFEHLGSGVDLRTEAGCATVVERFKPFHRALPPSIYASLLRDRLARLVRAEPFQIERELGAPPGAPPGAGRPRSKARGTTMTPMRRLIHLLLHHPELGQRLAPEDPLLAGAEPGVDLLRSLAAMCRDHPGITSGALIERWRDRPEAPIVHKLAALAPLAADIDPAPEFEGALEQLRIKSIRERHSVLIDLTRQRKLSAEETAQLRQLEAQLPGARRGAKDPADRRGGDP